MLKTSRVVKVIAILMMAIMMVATVSNIAMAVPASTQKTTSQIKASDITATYDNADMGTIQSKAQDIIGWIRNIAVIAGVIIITVLGVKYMLGSVEEKAEYKKSMIPLIVGIVVVMASTQIATMIFSIVGQD